MSGFKRENVGSITVIPELFKLSATSLTHTATRLRIYADRAKNILIDELTLTGVDKVQYTYYNDNLYDDQVLYFSTNMQLSDSSWIGESKLTKIILRRDQVSTSGIIYTPTVEVSRLNDDGGVEIAVGTYMRYDGISVHRATEYKIEDEITGEVVYEFTTRDYLNHMTIHRLPLKTNRVYRVSVRYIDEVGLYSNAGSAFYVVTDLSDSLSLESWYVVDYGSKLDINVAGNSNTPDNSLLYNLSIDGQSVGSGNPTKGVITINSTLHNVGDAIDLTVSYGTDQLKSKVFITKVDSSKTSTGNVGGYITNPNFKLENSIVPITVSNDDKKISSWVSVELPDGSIYGYDQYHRLNKYAFNRSTNSLDYVATVQNYNKEGSVIASRISINPLNNNLMIMYEVSTGSYLMVIDSITYDQILHREMPIGAGYSRTLCLIVMNDEIYLFSNNSSDGLSKEVYTMNINTYELDYKGTLVFDAFSSGVVNNSQYNVNQYYPVQFKGDIYFVNSGKAIGSPAIFPDYVFAYDTKTNTVSVHTEVVEAYTTGDPYQRGQYTLPNGKILTIYSQLQSHDRGFHGFVYLDLELGTVDDTHLDRVDSTKSHPNYIMLNDNTVLCHDDTSSGEWFK